MSKISQVSYQTVGSNKDRPRLWIEGAKLSAAGFVRGAAYSYDISGDTVTLRLDEAGSRKVCGRKRNGRDYPVIDLQLKDLEENFDPGTRVCVVFTENEISIRLHHEERSRKERETRFRTGVKNRTLTEASMFTGGGVSTMAIHDAIKDAGITSKLAWVVDAELKYLQVGYANNYAITDETTALIGRAEEIETRYFKTVDILSFSMPCSGFSVAGKAKHGKSAEEHEGAAALFGTLSAIRASNAAVLISENVPTAMTSPAYTLLKTELTRLGYDVFERIMDSADTGTVENRKRYWFVAISRGLSEGFAFTLMHPEALQPRRPISEYLEDNIPESAWSDHTYLKEKAERDSADGKGFTRQLLTGEETSCGTIGRHYNKRRSTEPFVVRGDGKERLFTPVEHARMKSVPECLVEGISATVAHEILGQSVDARQAYLAMAAVLEHATKQGGSSKKAPPAVAPAKPEMAHVSAPSADKQLDLFA